MANLDPEKVIADIKKGLISEAGTLADAGAMQPEQSDKFTDYVFQETKLGQYCRQERFDPATKEIDKIEPNQWVVYPKKEAADPRVRSGVATSKIELAPKDLVVVWQISSNFLRRNIEKGNAEEHIMRMIAKRAANNIETCQIHGDTLGPAMLESEYYGTTNDTQYVTNATMQQWDGWLKKARGGHTYDAKGAPITPDMLMELQVRMPTKFQGSDNKIIMPLNLNHRYNARLAARATGTGDAALAGASGPSWGIERIPAPLFQMEPLTVEHIALTGTDDKQLLNKGISSVIVTRSDLKSTPATPYILDTDYELDTANGIIRRKVGGAINDPQTVKVTYRSLPQIIYTDPSNLLIAVGREMKFNAEYRGVEDMFVFSMHMSLSVQIEELDRVVLAYNVSKTA